VQLEDRITVSTPEGVLLALQLAGAGSRFIAGAIDLVLQGVLVAAVALAGAAVGGGLGVALLAIGVFAATFLYDVLFEVLNAGRTPGKRLTHLRVVRREGAPVDLPASAVRNLARIVDGPPLAYLPTLLCVLLTARNQRPGDLAAGTLVVRDAVAPTTVPASAPTAMPSGGDWDVSAVTAEEMVAVRRFLERRASLEAAPRRELAYRLEQGLRPKVAGAPAGAPESFLEALTLQKSRS